MTVFKRTTQSLIAIAILFAAVWTYAQTPAEMTCSAAEIWMSGSPGSQFTASGLRIPPAARSDAGVTFCLNGVVVKADEARMVERNGQRTFTLNGQVTLTIPPR